MTNNYVNSETYFTWPRKGHFQKVDDRNRDMSKIGIPIIQIIVIIKLWYLPTDMFSKQTNKDYIISLKYISDHQSSKNARLPPFLTKMFVAP